MRDTDGINRLFPDLDKGISPLVIHDWAAWHPIEIFP